MAMSLSKVRWMVCGVVWCGRAGGRAILLLSIYLISEKSDSKILSTIKQTKETENKQYRHRANLDRGKKGKSTELNAIKY